MLNETGFENQQVSTTNVVGGYLKKNASRLSLLPFSLTVIDLC